MPFFFNQDLSVSDELLLSFVLVCRCAVLDLFADRFLSDAMPLPVCVVVLRMQCLPRSFQSMNESMPNAIPVVAGITESLAFASV